MTYAGKSELFLNQHSIGLTVHKFMHEFVLVFLLCQCPCLSACGAQVEVPQIIGCKRWENTRKRVKSIVLWKMVCAEKDVFPFYIKLKNKFLLGRLKKKKAFWFVVCLFLFNFVCLFVSLLIFCCCHYCCCSKSTEFFPLEETRMTSSLYIAQVL